MIVTVCLCWSLPGHAQDNPAPDGWQTSLAPPAVASRLPGGARELVVVAAGQASLERDAAAGALIAALRGASQVALVLDGSTLGEVGAIDDTAVVARCATLPVSHVVVVRLVDGQPPKVLVTIYPRTGGDVQAAFVATKGAALEGGTALPVPVETGGSQAGEGVSGKAMETVQGIQQQARQSSTENARLYEERFVGYDEVTMGQGVQTIQSAHFWVGKYKRPVDDAALYDAVGRPDLAARYTTRNRWRWGAGIAGVVVPTAVTVVLALTYTDYGCENYDYGSPDEARCLDKQSPENLRIGIVGASVWAIGTGAVIWSALADPHPVSMHHRRRLVHEHNTKLRDELGLPATSARATSHGFRASLRVAPALTPAFQGVVLEGRF